MHQDVKEILYTPPKQLAARVTELGARYQSRLQGRICGARRSFKGGLSYFLRIWPVL